MVNKKILIVIFIIVLLVILDLVIFLIYFKPQPLPADREQDNINTTVPPTEETINPLDYVADSRFEGIYFGEQAVSQKSLQPCYIINDEAKAKDCLLNVKNYLYQAAPDAQFCLQLAGEGEQADCIQTYVLINNKSEQCDFIMRAELKTQCVVTYVQANIAKGDIKVCDLLSATAQTDCLDQVYFEQAVSSGKLDSCNNITNAEMKTNCQTNAF